MLAMYLLKKCSWSEKELSAGSAQRQPRRGPLCRCEGLESPSSDCHSAPSAMDACIDQDKNVYNALLLLFEEWSSRRDKPPLVCCILPLCWDRILCRFSILFLIIKKT